MNYYERECERVCPLPIDSQANGQIKLKLQSDRGESKWINISGCQFAAIERILCDDLDTFDFIAIQQAIARSKLK